MSQSQILGWVLTQTQITIPVIAIQIAIQIAFLNLHRLNLTYIHNNYLPLEAHKPHTNKIK